MAETTIKCNLGDKHCESLNIVLRDAADVEAYLAKCEEAGIPCEQYKDVLAKQHALARGIKRTFFPNRL